MRPKGLLRGHTKISKKSKNTSLGSNLRELGIGQVDHFCKIAKSQMCSNLHFLLNGTNFLCLHLSYYVVHDSNVHSPIICFIFSIYFDFSLIKKWIKSNKWWKLSKIWFDLFFYYRLAIKICWACMINSNQWKLVQERHDWHENRKISYKLKIKSNLG